MSIYDAIEELNKNIPNISKHITLWRVEQAIDNKKSFIVPSDALLENYRDVVDGGVLSIKDILGLPYCNFEHLHSLFIWSLNPRSVVISEIALDFIYKSSLLDYVNTDLLFSFPSQAILVNQKFGNYDGILFCKDCIDDGISKQYSLNVSLFSNNNKFGRFLSLKLPNSDKFNPFRDFKSNPDWGSLAFVFYVLFYILNEYLHKQDLVSQHSTDYLGFGLEEQVEQMKYKKGAWRKAHWHTYKELGPDGRERMLMKWIKPVWIGG